MSAPADDSPLPRRSHAVTVVGSTREERSDAGIHHHSDSRWRPRHVEADVRPGPAAGAREGKVQRVFRNVDDPNHVLVFLEFESVEEAQEARRRLVESGALNRFDDKHGPNVVQEA
jgi:hypothetical protein